MKKHLFLISLAALSIGNAFGQAVVTPVFNPATHIVPLPAEVKVPVGAPSGTLGQVVSFLASQLANNRNISNVSETRIAVGSFVNLSNLEETDKLGMEVAENLMHEMHVRGFGVVDFKTRDSLRVRPAGDFVFSRDIADLKRSYNIHYFLAGTITRNGDGAVVNARLIQTDTSLVVSTAQGFISNHNLDRIFNERGRPAEKIVLPRVSANSPQVNLR